MRKNFVKIGNIQCPVNCLHYRHVVVKTKLGENLAFFVPCGKCYRCRKRAAAQWAFRLEDEASDRYVYNMLFTYAPEHIPYKDGVMVLNRQHVTDMLKRLRYYFDRYLKIKVRVFLCGEYSPEKKRPHYHAILFSPVNLRDVVTDHGVYFMDYLSQKLTQNCWLKGLCKISEFSSRGDIGKMVGYMVTYMMTSVPEFYQDKYVRPFRIMSRGLGERFTEHHPNVLPSCKKRGEYTYQIKTPHGTRNVAYPRYYLKKWLSFDEKLLRQRKYQEYTTEFERYISYLNNGNRKKSDSHSDWRTYKNRLEAYRCQEREIEHDNFRKRKVHGNNNHAD